MWSPVYYRIPVTTTDKYIDWDRPHVLGQDINFEIPKVFITTRGGTDGCLIE